MHSILSLRRLIVLIPVVFIGLSAVGAILTGSQGTGVVDPYPEQRSIIFDSTPTHSVVFTSGDGKVIQTIDVWTAETPAEQHEGLSNTSRDNLPENTGLLFSYDSESERSIVMREMQYPLDVVFIGADGQVTSVQQAMVEPTGTAERDLQLYTADAQYILEIPEGTASEAIKPGVSVEILSSPIE
ncbi:DUF192 domain-containing protein (plasmid) [Halorientalis pallida]|uniref:DUF192 domain-containing protein n=1 Tax=Halorientalis pallida TaxID=2479928 RepID=UPI003C6FC600